MSFLWQVEEEARPPTVLGVVQVDRLNGQTGREGAQTKFDYCTSICAGALRKDGNLIVFGPQLDLPNRLLSGGGTVSLD